MNKLHQKQTNCLQRLYRTCLIVSIVLWHPAFAEEASESTNADNGFKLGGYSSAGINIHSHGETEAALNEISLILTWQNDSRFSFFSELELERPLVWNEDKKFIHDDSYLDLERFYIDYNLSEKINLRAGRFLTPAGRWNLLHAAPLVWTTTRPLATTRLFPASTNGAMLYGAIPLKNKGLEYSVYVETLKDQHRDGDEILFKDVKGARVEFRDHFNIGINLMAFKERLNNTPEFKLIGLDFLTHYKNWELSGEGFQRFYNNGKNGGSGAYLQTVAPLGQNWYAIARLETFQRPDDSHNDKWLIGTALRVTKTQIFKMEVVGGNEERSESNKGFLASYAILF